jgi:hypothetical protein
MECDRADRTGLKPADDAISLFGRDVAGAAVYQYSVLVVPIVHIGSSFSEPSAADVQQSAKPETYAFNSSLSPVCRYLLYHHSFGWSVFLR